MTIFSVPYQTFFFWMYIGSAALYLGHLLQARHHWPQGAMVEGGQAHFWARSHILWKLTNDGVSPLTNGLVVLHVVLAFVPVANTALVWVSIWQTVFFAAYEAVNKRLGADWWGKSTAKRGESFL